MTYDERNMSAMEQDYWRRSESEARHQVKVEEYLLSIRTGIYVILGVLVGWALSIPLSIWMVMR